MTILLIGLDFSHLIRGDPNLQGIDSESGNGYG